MKIKLRRSTTPMTKTPLRLFPNNVQGHFTLPKETTPSPPIQHNHTTPLEEERKIVMFTIDGTLQSSLEATLDSIEERQRDENHKLTTPVKEDRKKIIFDTDGTIQSSVKVTPDSIEEGQLDEDRLFKPTIEQIANDSIKAVNQMKDIAKERSVWDDEPLSKIMLKSDNEETNTSKKLGWDNEGILRVLSKAEEPTIDKDSVHFERSRKVKGRQHATNAKEGRQNKTNKEAQEKVEELQK